MLSKMKKAGLLGGLATYGVVSNAAVDVAVTDAIAAAQADIVTVGSLLIGVAAVAMGLRWVKATFF
jgi:hypothetical protein